MFSTYTAGGALLEVLTAFTEQCTDITPISFQLKHNISKFFHKDGTLRVVLNYAT